jgi:hypothetical protein
MASRKALPYHASQARDNARMDIGDLLNELRPMLSREMTVDEKYRRLARAVDLAHRAIESLEEIKASTVEG